MTTMTQLHESVTRFVGFAAQTRAELSDALSGEELIALDVLAAPEAIAVVTRGTVNSLVTHVLATRGAWLAEHVTVDGTHHLHVTVADGAAALLVERCGFTEPNVERRATLDVSLAAYQRMSELVAGSDHRRALAALVADGPTASTAAAVVEAVATERVEVAGLAADGRRFVGCDLAVAGDARTGRWLVPSTPHVEPLPDSAFRHPSMSNVRVLLERVGTDYLLDELSLIFGDV
jgi:hypothetical protein